MSNNKPYSKVSFAIDLIMDFYETTNPIIIAEKAKEDLDVSLTIHQVEDYLDINRKEDYEKESKFVEYYQTYY